MKPKFNKKSFWLFTVNYIIGYGFIATVTKVIALKAFGFLAFMLAVIINVGIALVFARLSAKYHNEYGGSYAYSKKLNNKHYAFFNGWNQFIQGPILSSSAPFFLVEIAENITTEPHILNIVKIASVVFFVILIIISTLGIKLNKIIIFSTALIKWTVILLAIVLSIILSSRQNQFNNNFQISNEVNVTSVLGGTLSFMYAFGGMGDISTISKDAQTNFKKNLISAFVFILVFYFVFYLILLGVDPKKTKNFVAIFDTVLGTTGLVLFVIGYLLTLISSRLSVTITTTRGIIPLAADGFFFSFLAKPNKKNEYRNAIIFIAGLIFTSFIFFNIIPSVFNIKSFFNDIIQLGSIAFLVQYLLTFINALILNKKRLIGPIPLLEKGIYYLIICLIITILLLYFFPFIIKEEWTLRQKISLASYCFFIAIGYLFYFLNLLFKKKKMKNSTNQQTK